MQRQQLVVAAMTTFAAGPILTSHAHAQPAQRPQLSASTLTGAIVLDGVLDEPAWSRAARIERLTMVEPTAGGIPRGMTRISVLMDERSLVIGVECADSFPSLIVAFARERDADLANEDHIRIIFDTFLNGRTGYVFAVNANGARYDAVVSNAGESERKEWDTSWEAQSARTAAGWSVEMRIPVQSLGYKEGLREWGFNVERRVQRHLEVSRWASSLREVRFTHLARAGRLAALPHLVYGAGLTVRPAIVTGMQRAPAPATRDNVFDLSLDASQRLGANSLASLTYRTDFAETDVDVRRTNLTRFPLFFPEKRSFFLEGSDIFDFALAEERRVDVVPFFSRRIGLLDGRVVPLDGGAKLSGRIGGTSFGLLGARSRDAEELAPATWMFAGRLKQHVMRESAIGVIATAGDPRGRNGAWLGGADAVLRTSRFAGDRNLLVGLWGLATGRDSLAGDRSAWGITLSYPNNPFHASASYKHIGDGFDPSLGFVPRRGVDLYNAGFDARIRRPWPGVRDAVFQGQVQLVVDSLRRQETLSIFTAPLYLLFESGDRFELNVAPQRERLSLPFAIARDVAIPAGAYDWVRYRLEATFASKRRLSGRATYWLGSFYDGQLTQRVATIVARPSSLASFELSAEHNTGSVSAGAFTQDVFAARIQVNVSADLTLNSFVQYDDQSRMLGNNSRLRWQFHPLGELFVVYDHSLDHTDRAWGFESSQLLAKVQYALRW